MPITLLHLSGPLQGQQRHFDDDRERIVIGRDASKCDIVYPADLTIIGREHCALVREMSGDYALDVFGAHYVEIDGEPATDGAPIVSGKAITFGRHEGPRITATIERTPTGPDLSATTAQQIRPSIWKTEHHTRIVAAVAVFLAVVAGAGGAWQWWQLSAERAHTRVLVGQMAALAAQQKAQAAERISADARAHLSDAVYAVILRDKAGAESLIGTAWGVASNKLATNAHVAAEFDKISSGGSLVVRPSGSGRAEYAVRSVAIHPGYAAFDRYTNDDTFLIKNYSGWQRVESIGAYDVALLTIDGSLPSGSILRLADDAELRALAPGSPLAFAGYPYENIYGRSVQALGRTPIVQVGNMTSGTDYFLLPSDFEQRRLIEHNLPATGGASGSPIIDARNHVVALLSAGNITMINKTRMPSAAQINFGQRVDALRDLIEGRADQRLKADQTYWKTQTAAFARAADIIIANALDDEKPHPAAKAVLSGNIDFKIGVGDRYTATDAAGKPSTIRYKVVNLDLVPGSRHFVIAYGKGLSPIAAVNLIQDGNVVLRKEGHGPWAAANFTAPAKGAKLAILVELADTDVDLIIRDYVWEPSA